MAELATKDDYRRFEIIQNALHHEQEIFWTRFTGFATLHAGLFVIATATNIQAKPMAGLFVAILGITLSATWAEVQRLSLRYVDRWKPLYHSERERLSLDISSERPLDPRFSSTDLANFVPWAVAAAWVALFLIIVTTA